MAKFKSENLNPKNKKTSDCVVRAIAKASGRDYLTVFQDLCELAVKKGYMINDKHTYEKLLENYGFIKMKQPRKYDNTKYEVGEIDKLLDKDEKAVISCANHLTCYADESIVDIWDCRKKTIGNYYVLR